MPPFQLGSLSGAVGSLSKARALYGEDKRRDDEARRAQEAHGAKMESDAYDLQQKQEKDALNNLYTSVSMGEQLGWDHPAVQKHVQDVGRQYGFSGAQQDPGSGDVVFKTVTPDGVEAEAFRLPKANRANIMRRLQAGMRERVDLGGTTAERYPMEGIGREDEKTPTPMSPLDADVKRAQIGAFNANAKKALKDAQLAGTFGWEDLTRFMSTYTRVDQMGESHPLADRASVLLGEATAKHSDPVKALGYIMTNLSRKGKAAPAVPSPESFVDEELGGAGPPPEQAAPIAAPAPQPPPAAVPQRASVEVTPADLVAEIDSMKSQQETQRGMGRGRPNPNRESTIEAARVREQDARGELLRATGQTYEQHKLANLIQLKLKARASFESMRDRHMVRAVDEEIAALRGKMETLNQQVAGSRGAVVPGSARGGVVRAPYGGAVEDLSGTHVPRGILTRVGNMAAASGSEGGMGLGIRITRGREF